MFDDFAKVLADEQGNENALLLEILTSGYEDWDFIAAVEGPDDPRFYFDFVRDACGQVEIHFLRCGGKDSLLKFFKRANDYEWINKPRILYLADKDFDDYLEIKQNGVHYTEFYSIESYLTSRSFVEYVIQKYSTANISAAERNSFLDLFEEIFLKLAVHLKPYCAFMCELRSRGEHPSFDDFGIDQLFDLTCEVPRTKRNRMARARSVLNVQAAIDLRSLIRRTRSFDHCQPRLWLRGKLSLSLAKKSFELARRQSSQKLKAHLPASNHVSRDSLGLVFAAIGGMESLKLYCSS